MDAALRQKIERFLRPLLADLDGASRFEDVLRIESLARRLYEPDVTGERAFTLLILFHRTGGWLGRIGSISRAALALGEVNERELREVHAAVRKLEEPQSEAEKAVAAAILVDGTGVRGLAERFALARRHGVTALEVARETLRAPQAAPPWLPEEAWPLLRQRRRDCLEVCRMICEESGEAAEPVGALGDQVRRTPARS